MKHHLVGDKSRLADRRHRGKPALAEIRPHRHPRTREEVLAPVVEQMATIIERFTHSAARIEPAVETIALVVDGAEPFTRIGDGSKPIVRVVAWNELLARIVRGIQPGARIVGRIEAVARVGRRALLMQLLIASGGRRIAQRVRAGPHGAGGWICLGRSPARICGSRIGDRRVGLRSGPELGRGLRRGGGFCCGPIARIVRLVNRQRVARDRKSEHRNHESRQDQRPAGENAPWMHGSCLPARFPRGKLRRLCVYRPPKAAGAAGPPGWRAPRYGPARP